MSLYNYGEGKFPLIKGVQMIKQCNRSVRVYIGW